MGVKKIKSYSYYLTFDKILIIYVRDMSGIERSIAEISDVEEGTENKIALEVLKEQGYEIQGSDYNMDKQKLLELKADLFDKMIDERCDWEGPRSVIAYLIESGCTKEELLALAFDEDDVEDLLQEINNPKEEKEE